NPTSRSIPTPTPSADRASTNRDRAIPLCRSHPVRNTTPPTRAAGFRSATHHRCENAAAPLRKPQPGRSIGEPPGVSAQRPWHGLLVELGIRQDLAFVDSFHRHPGEHVHPFSARRHYRGPPPGVSRASRGGLVANPTPLRWFHPTLCRRDCSLS